MIQLVRLATALALFALAPPASAQPFPSKAITLVVPFAAGGPIDVTARLVGDHMSRSLGQAVIIENVGGAGGTLGANKVAKAAPDGYTLLLHHIGMSTAPSLYRKMAYDSAWAGVIKLSPRHGPQMQKLFTKK